MPGKLNDYLPEKDYAIWLVLGLVLLFVSQYFSKQPGTLAGVLRWLCMAAAVINYGLILYYYDRDRRAKKRESESSRNPADIQKK